MTDTEDPHRKSIPLSNSETAYRLDGRYLLIPADLGHDITVCTCFVDALDGYGAWLRLGSDGNQTFPKDEEIFLIEFHGKHVYTHRTRILRRDETRVWVDSPSLTQKEESQLSPFTGRHDYRVEVDVAAQIRLRHGEAVDRQPTPARLRDLSRGGMSVTASAGQPFSTGQDVNVQLISWEYPVNIDATISRVTEDGDKKRLALRFADDMTVSQREMLSAFILQVQRRDALERSLPTNRIPAVPGEE